jgi:hypothetical protein
MATVTDAGLEYIAKFFNDSESTAIINKIRIGASATAEAVSDTDLVSKYTDNGFEEATASTIEFLNTTAHPRTLHLQKTFTNGATANREVWECGAFTSSGTCVMRHVFQPYELSNNNIVPVGQTITIDIYIRIDAGSEVTYTKTVDGSSTEYKFVADISVSSTVGTDGIDPSVYTCEREKICFNGVVLPNASPPLVIEGRGAKTWKMSCRTTDKTEIDNLIVNQCLVQTGVSVTGYQYATSLQRYGALKIWNKTNLTHTTYLNCLLSGPVNIEQFGETYLFDITIIQSYYGDMT